ncbi:MAG: alpha/beta fold hydrolase [Richelia sp. RM2_1_2]|nr:alpha/beta fold hydrolase [Richelia sp. SM2_1_7]NJM19580.1 alpha/beta fold hydrolase [Richelia sp. SM1_7_0]NJN07051.1 alpha/beta fold hydrolase [Richelia sp. RM1_1_1]NJO27539.1 alpha/beta fold hydrolase [Richelia sp. SL_2_1]NJO58489.1 alpha/beta fold hydrolase [Richelia sp. RM2_1_2]
MDYIYLHGFASSPNSAKAKYIVEYLAQNQIKLEIPDLNCDDFSGLTISRQIKQVAANFSQNNSVTIIGSSLGGLTAAHIGEQFPQVKRLVLLAPAFGFLSHWLPTLGQDIKQRWQQEKYLMVYHYGEQRELPLSYDFLIDANQYQEQNLQRPIPTLILHGQQDEVIPIQTSRNFAQQRSWVELIELNSNHSLGNVMPEICQAIEDFSQLSNI